MLNFTLHLGLHKTGTTYLQNTLRDNNQLLSKYVLFVPMQQSRKYITPDISSNKNIEQSVSENFIRDIQDNAISLGVSEVILSEENFIGFPAQIRNSLYKDRVSRLKRLRKTILDKNNKIKKIVVSLREYGGFFDSMFLEANKRNYIDIKEVNKTSLMQFSYLEIIQDIKGVFPNAELQIVTFESFKKDNILLFESVTNIKNRNFLESLELSNQKRVSPSIQAYYDSKEVHNLHSLSDDVKGFIHRKLMNSDIHPKSKKSSILFSDIECAELEAKYEKDLSVLSSMVDNLV